MRRIARATAVFIGGAAMLATTAGPVAAAGGGGEHIALACGQTTYDVVTNGNGDWTPARDSNSTLVFHPTAFGEFHGTFTPSDGSPAQDVTDPPFERKNAPSNGHPTDSCTYHIDFSDDSGTFVGDGSVAGWSSGTPQG
ncbi:MAG: hypothetical protein QOD30_362 [Actinomycetota bacterium]|jgi:hypothetical protein|nr:hypothetical protein [Actinomycetota bacterium]